MIILGVEIRDKSGIKELGTTVAKLMKEGLHAAGEKWVESILTRHFTNYNSSRYAMKPRREIYRNKIKKKKGTGQGRFVDLKLSGQSERWARSFARVTSTSRMGRVRMSLPKYFTNPFIGSYLDKKGRRKRITQQPDKPAELRQINEDDRKDIRRAADRRIRDRIQAARFQQRITKVGG